MEQLATMVADKVLAGLKPSSEPKRLPRLTIAQFAFCAQRSHEHIRRKIRARIIPKTMFEGPPYLLDPKALALFGVSLEVALARLALFTKPAPAPRPAGSTPPSQA